MPSSYQRVTLGTENASGEWVGLPGAVGGKLAVSDPTALPLPSGAATAAAQATGNAALTNIDGKLPALVGGKLPVTDPATLPLPNGAATVALQNATLTATRAYMPNAGGNSSLAVTATSSVAQAITTGEVIRFSNAGVNVIGITLGTSTVAATIADSIDIMPGSAECFTIPAGVTHFAAISTGSATLKWTRGTGN